MKQTDHTFHPNPLSDEPSVHLSFDYEFTKERAFRFNYDAFYPYRFRKRRRLILILSPILLLLALYFGINLFLGYQNIKGDNEAVTRYFSANIFELIFVLFLLLIALFRLYQVKYGLKRKIEAQLNSPDLQSIFGPSVITFTDYGIHNESTHYRYAFEWKNIIEVVNFNRFLAIFITPSNGLILDKTALTEAQLKAVFEELSTETSLPIIEVNR